MYDTFVMIRLLQIKSVMSARLISIPYMAGGLEISIAI